MVEGAVSGASNKPCDLIFDYFIQQLSLINNHKNLFPKKCRTCGKDYENLYHYICDTEAKAQSIEDAGEIMGKSFTMIYRNCSCGNTLVITITDEIMPEIKLVWKTLRNQAEISGKPLKEIVASFLEEWENEIHGQYNCLERRERF